METEVSDVSDKKQARLRDLFVRYLIGLVVFIISCFVANLDFTNAVLIPIVVYFIIGIYLTKVYLPQFVDFHPVWKTIDNLVYIKLKGIFFWPIFYFFLLLKLGFLHVMR